MCVQEELLQYFRDEIADLRDEGKLFAKKFPDVARNLDFSRSESGDPQVERLIEAVAFISARIKRQNEVLMADSARTLLSCIYRDVLEPIPSLGLVEFKISNDTAPSFGNSILERGHEVIIKNDDGADCTFMTTSEVTLSPVEIIESGYVEGEDVGLDSSKYLHIKMKWLGDPNAKKSAKMRFFLTGPNRYLLWERIIRPGAPCYLFEGGEQLEEIHAPESVGMTDDESVFLDTNAYPGFRALIEYIVFPQKFSGFSLDISTDYQDTLDIYIPVSDTLVKFSKDNILINTVPIVNFFKTISEPVFFDQKVTEQIVIANAGSYQTERVHKIEALYKLDKDTGKRYSVPNYFDISKANFSDTKQLYWVEKKSMNSVGIENTYVSFVNVDFSNPSITEDDIFHCDLICSNRNAVDEIGVFSTITVEKALPVESINLVENLTDPVYLNLRDQHVWKLISFLSLNSLSLRGDRDLKNIRNIIDFFIEVLGVQNARERPAAAIISLDVAADIKHIANDAWRGFINGYTVDMQIDPKSCRSPILLGAIIERIFSNFVHMDSFVDVNVIENGGVVKQWSWNSGIIPML